MTLAALTASMNCVSPAQTAATAPTQTDLTAKSNPPATPNTNTPQASAATPKPQLQPTVAEEIEALKTRVEQLENEVRAAKAAALADSSDTAAMKAAEKELLAGTDAAKVNPASVHPAVAAAPVPLAASESSSAQAAAPAPDAAPAAPEIGAQTTKKGEPFPGDWTWLNSNGHAVDSPMSTKYFTPEFRADANYILDYNHPSDDTMGGATESFRSDEWQLEQLSIGGDFRINNVRGRILTMDGLFATTTPRNDGSPNRGQWDLAGAYKYISEGWGGYHWDVAHGLNVDAGIFVQLLQL
jgi:hypothetical protein